MALIKAYWPVRAQTRQLVEAATRCRQGASTAGACGRSSTFPGLGLAQAVVRRHHGSGLRWTGAAAACLAVTLVILTMFLLESSADRHTRSGTAAALPVSAITIVEEWEGGSRALVPGERIETGRGRLKVLVVNGSHRIVLNGDTRLSIEALAAGDRIGCLVKLHSGEIFAHVEQDGGRFTVATAHGTALIAGTTFDVRVTARETMLIVAEGTVRFASPTGAVQVTPGRTSTIVGDAAPTAPAWCQVAQLTAWAERGKGQTPRV